MQETVVGFYELALHERVIGAVVGDFSKGQVKESIETATTEETASAAAIWPGRF